MRHALVVFRKDVRDLRLPLAGFLGLMGIFGWMEAVIPRRREFQSFPPFFEILMLLAGAYLAVMCLHQETLPGDRQYWLTRPISRSSLFLAKAIFVLAFFNLPVLACNVAALLANGLSPLDYLVPLLARQVFLIALLILPGMALAAVTRDLGQFAIALFAVFGVVVLMGLQFSSFPASTNWGGFGWIRNSVVAAAALAVSGAVLALQYLRRRTEVSRAMLAAGVLACAAAPGVDLWHAAFRLQGGSPEQAASIRLAVDPNRDLAPGGGVLGVDRGTEAYARIVLPVQLAGIPVGMQVLSERIAARLQTPGGTAWSSGWNDSGGTFRLDGEMTVLPEDGVYWQYLYIDRAVYHRIKDAPVDLRTSAAFTLLSPANTTRLTPPTVAPLVPAFGFCATAANGLGGSGTINGVLVVVCLAPFQEPEWSALHIQSRRTGRVEEFSGSSQARIPGQNTSVSYGPYPANVGVSAWELVGSVKPLHNPGDFDVLLEGRHAVAHFQRDLEWRGVRLAQYLDAPAGGAR